MDGFILQLLNSDVAPFAVVTLGFIWSMRTISQMTDKLEELLERCMEKLESGGER